MRRKAQLTTKLILIAAALFSLGCQVTSQLFSTPTPTYTLTPTSTPTRTPTLTSTPRPDLSSSVLTLDDLPAGFEEISLEEFDKTEADIYREGLEPEEIFIFVNALQFQTITGYNFLLTNRINRISFDAVASSPELFLPGFVSNLEPENVRDITVLTGLEDIGDLRIGITMVALTEGVSFQVDSLMFRRDIIGAFIMSMTLEGREPNITIQELGRILDVHIQENPAIK
jgi:hypothetical protein